MKKHKTLELVNHGDQSYSVLVWCDGFYNELEPDLPQHLRSVVEYCVAGDYTTFPSPYPLNELIDWCNAKGIDVLVKSAIYNPTYTEA